MTTVAMRIEMVEVASSDGQPTTGFRCYAADIGVSAEGTDLTTVYTAAKAKIDAYLGASATLIYIKGDMRFSTA